jgi:hypothetical protein
MTVMKTIQQKLGFLSYICAAHFQVIKGFFENNTKEIITKAISFYREKKFDYSLRSPSAISLATRLGHIYGHNPSNHYGNFSDYGRNGHNGLSYYGRKYYQAVCLLKEHHKCRWAAKRVSKLLFSIKRYE